MFQWRDSKRGRIASTVCPSAVSGRRRRTSRRSSCTTLTACRGAKIPSPGGASGPSSIWAFSGRGRAGHGAASLSRGSGSCRRNGRPTILTTAICLLSSASGRGSLSTRANCRSRRAETRSRRSRTLSFRLPATTEGSAASRGASPASSKIL